MTETNDCDTDMDKTFIDATGFSRGRDGLFVGASGKPTNKPSLPLEKPVASMNVLSISVSQSFVSVITQSIFH